MKKFRLAVLAAVACTAALLTSCIKEESYEVEMAQLDVSFDTRGTDDEGDSNEQGDGIKDVMVWAYMCELDANDNPTNVINTATGWRYVQNVEAYGSLADIHIQLPICGDRSETATQSYVVVAVINTEQFGDTSITFDKNTTFEQLQNGTFDASNALFWNFNPDIEGLQPEDMPVSSWATITLSNTNTHPDNCLELTLPAYRAVAKAQLNMNLSSDKFGVVVTDVEIISKSAPTKGFILSKSSQKPSTGDAKRLCYPNQTAGPEWWVSSMTYAATTIPLANSVNREDGEFESTEFLPVRAYYSENPDKYTWVGSAFLYENDGAVVDAGAEYNVEPTGTNGGYYMQITYVFNRGTATDDMFNSDGSFNESLSDNKTAVRYVPLPKVVRNHDYRVNATVSVNVDGYLIVNYQVTDWTEATVNVPSFN